ncbi:nitroreductase [Paenibacillus doosanensis]|uniref:nitroreductase family protein n=1 Tax=Paenibacillus doosanensis TaxID=1229154 RepID=UPI0021808866|nr:nitroreductase [Paenibacillus doosanensis]MCS7460403.1 nitroreductase [Paenibacillus doosanensis]
MSIAKTIRERRSIRTFNRTPVPRELVIQLLNDAVWAPNHGLREPWRFIYVDSEDGKVRLVDLITAASGSLKRYRLLPPKLKEFMRNRLLEIPAHLIVVTKEEKNEHKRDEDFAAVCCLMQNLQLVGWEQRLGMIWSTIEFIFNPEFRDGLGVRKDERIVGILHMGYFDKVPRPKPRTPAEKKLTIW